MAALPPRKRDCTGFAGDTLIGIVVALLASVWGGALSLLWRHWQESQRYPLIVIFAFALPAAALGLGTLFLLACLKLAQWGGTLGLTWW